MNSGGDRSRRSWLALSSSETFALALAHLHPTDTGRFTLGCGKRLFVFWSARKRPFEQSGRNLILVLEQPMVTSG